MPVSLQCDGMGECSAAGEGLPRHVTAVNSAAGAIRYDSRSRRQHAAQNGRCFWWEKAERGMIRR